ncbi:RCC1 domain-containing protein [Solwaraspora sp. WMMB762]|uniref:RCC1 domain-containing protein n=1 Tax=Solwaraspora sp. WMMB762 TaxID=3404120 RepID=UPI003B95131C
MTATAAGYSHSLALRSNGTVVAWGSNYFGELGNGQFDWGTTPVPVQVCAVGQIAPCTQFLNGVIAIAAGQYYSLALLRDRTVVAWGDNSTGQLGNGTYTVRSTPVRVCAVAQVAPCGQFLAGVRTLTAGIAHSLAQLTNGTAVAWGSNYYRQLGDSTAIDRTTPVPVCAVEQGTPCNRYLTGVRSLAAGGYHSLAVVDSALAVAWGRNDSGQLGDGTTTDRRTPVRVCATGQVAPCGQQLNAVRAVAGGISHSMALRGDGGLVSWGSNFAGKLGDGTTTDRLTPVRVCAAGQTAPCTQYLYGIRHIGAGGYHSMAQLSSGGVLTWGFNSLGQLGDGGYEDQLTPVRVCAVGQTAPCTQHLTLIRAVSAGSNHNLALQVDYTVIAWGYNFYGELGDGTTITRPVPVQVVAPRPALRS